MKRLDPSQIIDLYRTCYVAFVNMRNLQYIFDLFNTKKWRVSESDFLRYATTYVQNMSKTVRHTVPKFIYSVKIRNVTSCIAHRLQTIGKNIVLWRRDLCTHILYSSTGNTFVTLRRVGIFASWTLPRWSYGFIPWDHMSWLRFFTYFGMLFLLLGSILFLLRTIIYVSVDFVFVSFSVTQTS